MRDGVDALLRNILRGDQLAWMNLFSQFGPMVERIARSTRTMGSYRSSEDDVRNVMARVFERLRRDDYRALRSYQAWRDRNPTKQFEDWLTIVTVNVARNYVSAKLGSPSAEGGSIKQLVNTYADALEVDGPVVLPHITTKDTVRRILAYANEHLPDDQLAALAAWLEGEGFEDIARDLGLADVPTAQRLVRAALARLRREFADR